MEELPLLTVLWKTLPSLANEAEVKFSSVSLHGAYQRQQGGLGGPCRGSPHCCSDLPGGRVKGCQGPSVGVGFRPTGNSACCARSVLSLLSEAVQTHWRWGI